MESNTTSGHGVGGGVDVPVPDDPVDATKSKQTAPNDTDAPSKQMRVEEGADPSPDNITMDTTSAHQVDPSPTPDDQMLQQVRKSTKQHNRTTLGNNVKSGTIVTDNRWSKVQTVGNTEWLSSVVQE